MNMLSWAVSKFNNLARRVKLPRGQATTEMALLFPIFMFFLFGFVKIFALLVLVQKVEISAYYAARRWQLESHRNVVFGGRGKWDERVLKKDIEKKVRDYLGCNKKLVREILGLVCTKKGIRLKIKRAQVWNILTLKVKVLPWRIPLMKFKIPDFEVTKFVPNRDRPIGYNLPGFESG